MLIMIANPDLEGIRVPYVQTGHEGEPLDPRAGWHRDGAPAPQP